jgi:hypothetical protein
MQHPNRPANQFPHTASGGNGPVSIEFSRSHGASADPISL